MIPEKYARAGERVVASYDYTDIAEGTGIIKLYGSDTGLSGSTTYILTEEAHYSDDIETAVNSGGTWTFNLSQFNLPKIIKGTAIVSFSVGFEPGTSALFVTNVALQKVRGGTATTIGSANSEVISSAGGDVEHHYTLTIDVPQTQFKKGDNLRLLFTPDFPAGSTYLAHDPMGRDGSHVTIATATTTKLELYVPFKIDL